MTQQGRFLRGFSGLSYQQCKAYFSSGRVNPDSHRKSVTHIRSLALSRPLNYKIPESGVILGPEASTSNRSFFITSAGIHFLSTLTVLTRFRLLIISIGANLLLGSTLLIILFYWHYQFSFKYYLHYLVTLCGFYLIFCNSPN